MDRKITCSGAPLLWLLAMSCVVLLVLPHMSSAAATGNYVGSETCLECHEDVGPAMSRTVHGNLQPYQYPGDATGCEACHGLGSTHSESEDPADIFTPRADMGNEASATCLACHKTGHTMGWETSTHAENDVECSSCHKIHTGTFGKALLQAPQEQLCESCHQDVKGKFQLPSHHPLREGFMTCSSCHDVHSGNMQGVAEGEMVRDACLSCHTQYAGPFIFEHSPVEEDCRICHDPHGAVANNLLKQNEPFICLQCHQPHFHSILAGYEGDFSTPTGVSDADPGYLGMSGTSHYDSMKRSMLTKCSQCHQSVHGTDLPSQSITGQGRALNR